MACSHRLEYKRLNDPHARLHLIKLDPTRARPVVLKRDSGRTTSRVWATPALYRDIVIYATDEGSLGLDRLRAIFVVVQAAAPTGPPRRGRRVSSGCCAGCCPVTTCAIPRAAERVVAGRLGLYRIDAAVWKGASSSATLAGGVYGIG